MIIYYLLTKIILLFRRHFILIHSQSALNILPFLKSNSSFIFFTYAKVHHNTIQILPKYKIIKLAFLQFCDKKHPLTFAGMILYH